MTFPLLPPSGGDRKSNRRATREKTCHLTQGPREGFATRRHESRCARFRHRRSRSITRRNAWRQEGLQNRREELG
jgi:hypothetical protein